MIICIHEDRPAALVGVKLLVASLRRHCPDVPVVVSVPSDQPDIEHWLAEHHPGSWLRADPSFDGRGWNTKPSLLLKMLDEGHDEVVWIDSDVVLAGDFRPLIGGSTPQHVVPTEELYWGCFPGGSYRTELWGLEPGRRLSATLNTAFVRMTEAHRDLLRAWQRLLAVPSYERSQTRPFFERPIHMMGDQDVLTALVGAKRFSHIPLRYLKRGRDIVHSITPAGYTVTERVRNLFAPLPALIHGVEPKHWERPPQNPPSFYERLSLELCPYSNVARPYYPQLDGTLEGIEIRTWMGKLCHALARGNPTLQGLPLSLLHSFGKRTKRMLGMTPWATYDAHCDPDMRVVGQQIVDELLGD